MLNPRRKVRVSHLTLAHAVKRMRKGDFTMRDLQEASGLGRETIYELLNTFENQGLIVFVKTVRTPGRPGPGMRLFSEVREVLR